MVPKGGLEPPRVTPHAPQTCASASSATSAQGVSCRPASRIVKADTVVFGDDNQVVRLSVEKRRGEPEGVEVAVEGIEGI